MKIIRLKEVIKLTGLGRSTIYAKVANGLFPANVKLGGHATGWVESEVLDWINALIEERDIQALENKDSEDEQ